MNRRPPLLLDPSRLPWAALLLVASLGVSSMGGAGEPTAWPELLAMVEAGVPETVVLLEIESSGLGFDPDPARIIRLHEAGAGEELLSGLLRIAAREEADSPSEDRTPTSEAAAAPPHLEGISWLPSDPSMGEEKPEDSLPSATPAPRRSRPSDAPFEPVELPHPSTPPGSAWLPTPPVTWPEVPRPYHQVFPIHPGGSLFHHGPRLHGGLHLEGPIGLGHGSLTLDIGAGHGGHRHGRTLDGDGHRGPQNVVEDDAASSGERSERRSRARFQP